MQWEKNDEHIAGIQLCLLINELKIGRVKSFLSNGKLLTTETIISC